MHGAAPWPWRMAKSRRSHSSRFWWVGNMPVLFCFGLGFTAQALATRLAAEGWGIIGTCRSPEKAADLAGRGWDLHVFDGSAPLADEIGRASCRERGWQYG